MKILLETERLILRPFTPADAEHLYKLDNDPEVMRYINGGTPTSREIIKNDILPGFLRYDDRFPGYGFWAAVEKSRGNFVGWFCFRPTEENSTTVILGYRFIKAVWGQGYATEGAKALIEKGFREWETERVVASTYQDNLASQRVMQKLGMRFVRRFRLSMADIQKSDTSHTDSVEIWDGDDVEICLR